MKDFKPNLRVNRLYVCLLGPILMDLAVLDARAKAKPAPSLTPRLVKPVPKAQKDNKTTNNLNPVDVERWLRS